MTKRVIHELIEYIPTSLPRSEISENEGEQLWELYGDKINVDFPSPKTNWEWRLTPLGWVGFIPITQETAFSIQPKVPLHNLFGMWEYAYRLKSFYFLKDIFQSQSLEEFYTQLASVFARRILDRGRKGYYRAYIPFIEELPYLRGHLDVPQLVKAPWDTRFTCHYEEHTPDIEDNQILAWTLSVIARSGLCQDITARTVRRAFRSLQGLVRITQFDAKDCLGRFYNRLNQDYQTLHALSRFFLENTSPTHKFGDNTMLPFFVNMAQLFELFISEYLKVYLPKEYSIKTQERIEIGDYINFKIDMVLYSNHSKDVICVLDTKYKSLDKSGISMSDIEQVVTYAEIKHCQEAILIYPQHSSSHLNEWVGNKRVRRLTFDINGNLEAAGTKFINDLIQLFH